MKKLLKYLSVVASAALIATSCNMNDYPVFDDNDAFVAVDVLSLSASEESGVIEIPVTLASVAGLSSTVTYTVTDGTAVEGVNYNVVNSSKTIEFSSEARTGNIEIEIIDLDAEYTGDLSFSVTLSDAGSVNLGSCVTCDVTISDEDHPLLFILNTYTLTAEDSTGASVSFDVTLSEVEGDTSMVYFTNLSGDGATEPGFYGNMSSDNTAIYVALGQSCLIDDSTLALHGAYEDDSAAIATELSGNMIITIADDGATLEFNDYTPAIYDSESAAYDRIVAPGTVTATK